MHLRDPQRHMNGGDKLVSASAVPCRSGGRVSGRTMIPRPEKYYLLPAVCWIQHDGGVEPGDAVAAADHEHVLPDGCRRTIPARRRHRGASNPAADVRRKDVDLIQPLEPVIAAEQV